jgi:phosphoribosyl 1,2-cyclic phosphodiesterase
MYIKKRIMGRHGHMSNNSAMQLLTETSNPTWKKVFLTHLSRECNRPAEIEKMISASISDRVNFDIEIIDPDYALGIGCSL